MPIFFGQMTLRTSELLPFGVHARLCKRSSCMHAVLNRLKFSMLRSSARVNASTCRHDEQTWSSICIYLSIVAYERLYIWQKPANWSCVIRRKLWKPPVSGANFVATNSWIPPCPCPIAVPLATPERHCLPCLASLRRRRRRLIIIIAAAASIAILSDIFYRALYSVYCVTLRHCSGHAQHCSSCMQVVQLAPVRRTWMACLHDNGNVQRACTPV